MSYLTTKKPYANSYAVEACQIIISRDGKPEFMLLWVEGDTHLSATCCLNEKVVAITSVKPIRTNEKAIELFWNMIEGITDEEYEAFTAE
jgi:hypothetical protein